jgi:diguanylate cyclase (GGDEF)-like protein/PAS domain S-box-containing protein
MPLSKISASELLDALPDAAIIIDNLGNIRFSNRAFYTMLGYSEEEVLNENIIHFLRDDSIFSSCMADVSQQGECRDQETYFIHKDGHFIHTVKNVRLLPDGDEPVILATIRDLSHVDSKYRELEKRQSITRRNAEQLSKAVSDKEQELFSAKTQLEEILSTINEIIWYIDDETMQVRYVSKAVESIFGITQTDFLSTPDLWQSMVYEEDRQAVASFFQHISDGASHSIDFRIVRSDGEVRWLNSRVSHHPDLHIFIGVSYDTTESKQAQELIEFMAYHDPLTQLPNRLYLSEKLNSCLPKANVIEQIIAILFLDLDNFKYVNDSKGHEVGDLLLVQMTKRLQQSLGAKSEMIRFGGDEFIILMTGVQDRDDIDLCCFKLLDAFTDAFIVDDEEFFLTASIGIGLYPEHATTGSDLIKHADTAMYAAKRAGKNQFRYYHPRMDAGMKDFLRIEQLIREGIKAHYFTVYYQPLVDALTRDIKGFEALLRYHKPDGEALSPEEFIPVAERTGEIVELSETVFRHACATAQRLYDLTGQWLPISINLSARQFQDQNLLSSLKRCIRGYGIPAYSLSLEVTESIIMKDIENVSLELTSIRANGFTIALDDFGTGYSSLEYLAKLPIDTLKIDKSFIQALFDNPQNEHLVVAITNMAKAMQMKVVAEGVENEREADFLTSQGVDTLQGYLFCKALPVEEIEKRLQAGRFDFTKSKTETYII